MGPIIAGGIFEIGKSLINHFFPDPAEAKKAEAELLHMQQSGQFKTLEARMTAIVMEAKSTDPWTSRARPSFLYVMYVMMLASIPAGIAFAFYPGIVEEAIKGMKLWLHSIPTEMWYLFGAGYLGYVWKRTDDKKALLGAKK